MPRRLSRILWLTLALCLALPAASALAGAKPLAAVSIPPQAFLAERLAGDKMEVFTLLRPGQEPHSFAATPRQMAALSTAKVWFTLGLPFEKNLAGKIKAGRGGLLLSDCGRGIARRHMAAHHHHEDEAKEGSHAKKQGQAEKKEHGEEPGHGEGEKDPHIWLSPANLKAMAANMAREMAKIDPANAAFYQKNLAGLSAELTRLNNSLAAALAPYKGRVFFVYHPAFGYFADAYGLKQEAAELEGKSPTAKQLAKLIEEAKEDGVRVIFVQPQFPKAAANRLAQAINGVVAPADPLAKDVINNLAGLGAAIARALKEK